MGIQTNWTRLCNGANIAPQLWGIVTFGRQVEDKRKKLMAELRGRSDIEWNAGGNWCLVCERQSGNDLSLASCNQSALHVAVAGRAWSLDKQDKEDAELVADLYRTYGDSLINQSDGQFSGVIVDEKNSRAVLTVNWPGGYHRLYYCTDDHSLCFATHLGLLFHRCGWPAKTNEEAVVDLLRFGGLVSETSLLEGVHRVIPGYAAVYEKGHITQCPVYEYPSCQGDDPSDTAEMERLHREAMQKRISGQGDFGLFLSGGLDSSMNVAAAAELSSEPVKTFSVAFDADEFDESQYSRLVAERYNTRHLELRLNTDGCLDRLPEMVWAMQEPISDYSYIPTFYAAEAIKEHVNAAIGGDGPDHLLGRNYQYAAWYDLLHRIPLAHNAAAWLVRINGRGGKIRHGFWRYARRKRPGRQLWQSLACGSDPCGSGMLNSFCNVVWGDLPPSDLVNLISPDLSRRTSVAEYNREWQDRWQQYQASGAQDRFILADASLSGLCEVFAKVGAMCSAHNLVVREPYLATPLVRYFCGLKNSWKVDGSWLKRMGRSVPTSSTKRILRRAAAEHLPGQIVQQKQKQGFGFPLVQSWQQATSAVGAQQIFGALLNNTDWLNHEFLDRLVQEQATGARNHRYLLLLLAALDQWFRMFVEGKGKSPSWRWSQCFGAV